MDRQSSSSRPRGWSASHYSGNNARDGWAMKGVAGISMLSFRAPNHVDGNSRRLAPIAVDASTSNRSSAARSTARPRGATERKRSGDPLWQRLPRLCH
jgi:hypothetical protein